MSTIRIVTLLIASEEGAQMLSSSSLADIRAVTSDSDWARCSHGHSKMT